jgi:hypothetical protein
MPHYRVEIDPESYDDDNDCGYVALVEAASREEAYMMACKACDNENEWEEGTTTPDNARLVECSRDYLPEVLEAAHRLLETMETPRTRKASDAWDAFRAIVDEAGRY